MIKVDKLEEVMRISCREAGFISWRRYCGSAAVKEGLSAVGCDCVQLEHNNVDRNTYELGKGTEDQLEEGTVYQLESDGIK